MLPRSKTLRLARLFGAVACIAMAAPLGAARAQIAGQGGAAQMETIVVSLDHARVMRLPEKASTVIVGNPAIADISLQKNGILVITGKSFGVTNLIALDSTGAMIAESQLSVRASDRSVMTVQRGTERESYSCTPACQPAVQLGDANKFFGETGGQISQRNALATQSK